jgi:hypothetical protein
MAPSRRRGLPGRPRRRVIGIIRGLATGLLAASVVAGCAAPSPAKPVPGGASVAGVSRPVDGAATSSARVRIAIKPLEWCPTTGCASR